MCARYVHRVGRTARMGSVGEAVLFLLPSERGYLAKLESTGLRLEKFNVVPALDNLPQLPSSQVQSTGICLMHCLSAHCLHLKRSMVMRNRLGLVPTKAASLQVLCKPKDCADTYRCCQIAPSTDSRSLMGRRVRKVTQTSCMPFWGEGV